MYYWIR